LDLDVSDDLCGTMSEELFAFIGRKDPFSVLCFLEVFAHLLSGAPYPFLLLGPCAELPVHYIISLLERFTCCTGALVVAPSRDPRMDFTDQLALRVDAHLSDDLADLLQMSV
jgi:hypothetical protein